MTDSSFNHPALELSHDRPLVYTAMSKHSFYLRMFISKFVLDQGSVPLNPFMIFDYYLLDSVDRDVIREANNNLVKRADELWVFGAVSDGVLAEVQLAHAMNKTVRFFDYQNNTFVELDKEDVAFEDGVAQHRGLL